MSIANEKTAILKKINAIQKDLSEKGYLPKDGKNEFHKYNYTTESQYKAAIQPLLAKHGVVFHLDQLSHERLSMANGKEILTLIELNWSFTCVDTGSELSGTYTGSGSDSGDKGIYKATTGAIKYIFSSVFLIPTGDDPERDTGGDPQKQTNARQRSNTRQQSPPQSPPSQAAAATNQAKGDWLGNFRKIAKARMEDLIKENPDYLNSINESFGIRNYMEITEYKIAKEWNEATKEALERLRGATPPAPEQPSLIEKEKGTYDHE